MNQPLSGFFGLNFHGIGLLHYLSFAAVFFIFVLLILLLNATKRHKLLRNGFAYLAFVVLFGFPFLSNWLLSEHLFKLSLQDTNWKELQFVDKIVFKATAQNDSVFTMRNCKIYAIISPKKSNALEQNLSYLVSKYPFMDLDIILDPRQSSEIYFSFNETRALNTLYVQPKLRCVFDFNLKI